MKRRTYWEQRPTMTLATEERSDIHFLRPEGDRPISSYSSSKEARRLSAHLKDFSRTSPSIRSRVLLIIAISLCPPPPPPPPRKIRDPSYDEYQIRSKGCDFCFLNPMSPPSAMFGCVGRTIGGFRFLNSQEKREQSKECDVKGKEVDATQTWGRRE